MQEHQAIARAIEFIGDHVEDQPGLGEVAEAAGMSVFQCQRVFSALAGVSPKKFLQFLTLERAKAALEASASVLDAAYEAGLSGPGRLHDLFVGVEAATPGEYKTAGAGMTIRYGEGMSPFGRCLVLWSERGVTGLGFVDDEGPEAARLRLCHAYRAAEFVSDPAAAAALVARIFAPLEGRPQPGPDGTPLRLFLSGTAFQMKVWEALMRIPAGALVTYEQIARAVGQPGASRAVGSAVGSNPISYLVPCHRVIRGTGAFGNYAWGPGRKRLMIGAEGARAQARGMT